MVFKSLLSFKSISYVPSVTPTNIEIRIITGFFFWPHHKTCRILFCQAGIEPGPQG